MGKEPDSHVHANRAVLPWGFDPRVMLRPRRKSRPQGVFMLSKSGLSLQMAVAGLTVGAVCLTALGATPQAFGQSRKEAAGVPASDPESRFRATFGLDASIEARGRAAADNAGRELTYGVPLTRPEEAELRTRQSMIQGDSKKIEERLGGRHSARFGGLYMDNRTGRLIVNVVGDPERARQEISSETAHPGRLEVAAVANSYASLLAIQEQIRARQPRYFAEGTYITSSAPDPWTNRVIVGVAGDVDAASDRLAEDFPRGAFEVRGGGGGAEDHGVTGNWGTPYMGGLQITNDQTKGGCTTGFSAYRNTVPTTYFMLTAGHCGTQNDLFRQGGTGSTPMGRISLGAYVAQGDAARITIPAGTQSKFIRETSNSIRGIGSEQPKASDREGDAVCMVGMTSTVTRCGEIRNTSYDLYRCDQDPDGERCASFTVLRQASYGTNDGDSGGPVCTPITFSDDVAAGINKGTDDF
jgi:hypothetical protein